MFQNLGKTLALLRQMRGKSRADLARGARIGKSQLSKYEAGKELPRLDSLERMLTALDIGVNQFFYTLALVNERFATLDATPHSNELLLLLPPREGSAVLRADAEKAFSRLLTLVLDLHTLFYKEGLLGDFPSASRAESGGATPAPGEPSDA